MMRLVDKLEELDLYERVMQAINKLDGKRGKSSLDCLTFLNKWIVVIDDNMLWNAGFCTYDEELIHLHCKLEGSNLIETILHEVGHVIVLFFFIRFYTDEYGEKQFVGRFNNHGSEWKFVMRLLGAEANVEHTLCKNIVAHAVERAPYVYVCGNCKMYYPREEPIIEKECCGSCVEDHILELKG